MGNSCSCPTACNQQVPGAPGWHCPSAGAAPAFLRPSRCGLHSANIRRAAGGPPTGSVSFSWSEGFRNGQDAGGKGLDVEGYRVVLRRRRGVPERDGVLVRHAVRGGRRIVSWTNRLSKVTENPGKNRFTLFGRNRPPKALKKPFSCKNPVFLREMPLPGALRHPQNRPLNALETSFGK